MTIELTYPGVITIIYSLVGVCLIIALIYAIQILYRVNKISKKAEETVNMVSKLIVRPMDIARKVYDKIDSLLSKKEKKEEKE